MLHLFAIGLLPLALSADAPLDAGAQLTYRGSVEPTAGAAAGSGHKTFDLTLWIVQRSDNGSEIFWLVDEAVAASFPGRSISAGRASMPAGAAPRDPPCFTITATAAVSCRSGSPFSVARRRWPPARGLSR